MTADCNPRYTRDLADQSGEQQKRAEKPDLVLPTTESVYYCSHGHLPLGSTRKKDLDGIDIPIDLESVSRGSPSAPGGTAS